MSVNHFELNVYRLLMQKRSEKLDVLLYGFAYFSVHLLKILYIEYLLSALDIKLCTDFKCVNTEHLMLLFLNLFLQKSSHMFTFQCKSCNEEAIKLLWLLIPPNLYCTSIRNPTSIKSWALLLNRGPTVVFLWCTSINF